ncbi:hypothetical protein F5J12DRAFT_858711 [Pisolithus orientalis]|uniref:uncharacterized protein n=1 Tax=Pisolithus orientalis TaxID=936130 RepID=UPI00222541BC|nr:uncharacterized protein F5J12DRAFT_858711 [Pisolithus orientalis]KAI5993759.1 hypothetical protein F5J12DRAFT_858711 [Pisolithus orientalis]
MQYVSRASSRNSRQDRTLTSKSSSNFVTTSHKLRLRHTKRNRPYNLPKRKPRRNTRNNILTNLLGNGSWCAQCLGWSDFIHSLYPPEPSLLIAYTSLRGALLSSCYPFASGTGKEVRMKTYIHRLADAMIRAAEAIYAFLFVKNGGKYMTTETPSSSMGGLPAHLALTPSPPTPSRGGRYQDLTCASIAMCYPLLAYTLTTAFPALLKACEDLSSSYAKNDTLLETIPLPSSERPEYHREFDYHQINRVIDVLLELILLPFVRAFRPLCWARLLPVIEGAKSDVVDVDTNAKAKPGVKAKGGSSAIAKGAVKEKGKGHERQPKSNSKEDATKTKAGNGKANQKAKDKGTFHRDTADADPTGNSIPVLSGSHSYPSTANVCTDILALLGMAARALESLSSSTSHADSLAIAHGVSTGVRERLGLEAIRELAALYEDPVGHATSPLDYRPPEGNHPCTHTTTTTTPSLTPAPPRNAQTHTIFVCESTATRNATDAENPTVVLQASMHKAKEALHASLFRTLFNKDTAWYLCSVLHLTISSSTGSVISGDVSGFGSMPVASSTSLRGAENPQTAGSASPPSSPLLARAVIAGIGRLLRLATPEASIGDAADNFQKTSTNTPIDPIIQNIFLAICEQTLKGYAEMDPELLE